MGNAALEHLQASDASLCFAHLRVLGSAMARVLADATAFAHCASRLMVNVAAFDDGPADRAVRQAWVEEFAAALRQAYPGRTWERLAAIKRHWTRPTCSTTTTTSRRAPMEGGTDGGRDLSY
jgi:hypothetical protein